MGVKEKINKTVEDTAEKIVDEAAEKGVYMKANDWFGEHNVFSRLIILTVIFVFIYSFVVPLSPPLVEISAWVLFAVFTLVSVGINSIKLIGDIIIKIKKG